MFSTCHELPRTSQPPVAKRNLEYLICQYSALENICIVQQPKGALILNVRSCEVKRYSHWGGLALVFLVLFF